MITETEREALFADQRARYPLSRLQDLVKALHQSMLGCGHFALADEAGVRRLESEMEMLEAAASGGHRYAEGPAAEPLACGFSRLHLWGVRDKLCPGTLQRLFSLCSGIRTGAEEAFVEMIREMALEAEEGRRALSPEDSAFLRAYAEQAPRALSHSALFRQAYLPAYRVLSEDVIQALPAFFLIERVLKEKKRVVLAIDGGAASGKSSLAALVQKVYGGPVIHMDDFFLRPEQRTAQRFLEPGGNVDRERFSVEVLPFLTRHEPFSYRAFDCAKMTLGEEKRILPGPVAVVEGAYSMHPFFGRYYDASLFLKMDKAVQKSRVMRRERCPAPFFERWIPLEEAYFSACRPFERCDLVLSPGDTRVRIPL